MAIVRLEALKMLAAAIKEAVPSLVDHICLGQADPRKDQSLPTLTIIPVRWKYQPAQASEHFEPAPDRVVLNVGAHFATIQLRLVASNSYQRAALEQALIDLFLGTELHPGVLLTTVIDCEALGDFLAAWELDTDEWDDSDAGDQQFVSLIALDGIIPALVTRGSVYTIDQLQLGLTHEFSADYTATTFNTSTEVEVVQINQDGTIEPV